MAGLMLVFAAGPVVAEPVVVLAQAQDVNTVLTNIRNWLMGILAGLAIVVGTVGGVRRVFAAGDPGEIEAANRCFRSAGWGFTLAALAPLAVSILQSIVGL